MAFTGETVTYTIMMMNMAEDDAPYDKFYIEQVTDSSAKPDRVRLQP